MPTQTLSVAELLPAEWNPKRDILVIAGEHAVSLAAPFVQHGLKRVFLFDPAHNVDDTPLIPGVTLVQNREQLIRVVELLPGRPAQLFAGIRTPQCSLAREVTESIFHTVATLVRRKKANQAAQDELAPFWARNGLRNLPAVSQLPLVSRLKDKLKGVPMVIVGAGPSLEKNVHLLADLKDKALVLGVNRSLSSLQAAGVPFDLSMALEAQDIAYHFDDIDLSNSLALILACTVNPNLFQLAAPRRFTFANNINAIGWMFGQVEGVDELPTAGSVSCSALSLALLWGCDPIILVGQDLSFPDGAYYASIGCDGQTQAVWDEASQSYTLDGFGEGLANTERVRNSGKAPRMTGTTVPGYYGGSVPTTTDFAYFRQWFENTANDNQARARFYNCTEGGAYIGGMEHVPLQTLVDRLATIPFGTRALFDDACEAARTSGDRALMEKQTHKLKQSLDQTIVHADRCIGLIEQSLAAGKPVAALAGAEAELRTTLGQVSVLALMDQQRIREYGRAGKHATTLAESLNASGNLYKLILEQGQRIRLVVEEVLKDFEKLSDWAR